ncbi:MAG: hypothetical protein RR216_01660 [Pseudoflavonifractor sp.]
MEELYLPVLSHFQNENIWLASSGRLRFKITPDGEGLTAETWEGPWSYAFSSVECTEHFPLTEEGLGALRSWLSAQGEAVNARPEKTFTQTLETRVEKGEAPPC